MEVALFRPTQRQAWVDWLRSTGYTVRFVHDPERLQPSTQVVIIDTAVAKWKDYIRLLKVTGIPIALLLDEPVSMGLEEQKADGIMVLTTEEDIRECISRHTSQKFDSHDILDDAIAHVSSTQDTQPVDKTEKLNQPGAEWLSAEEEKSNQRNQLQGDHEPTDKMRVVPLSRRKKQNQALTNPSLPLLEMDAPIRSPPKQEDEPAKALEIPEDEKRQPPSFQARVIKETEKPIEAIAEESAILPPSSLLPAADRRQLPSMVTVYSPKGGVGKTVFLLHLAALLAMEKCRVCLLDLDLNLGTVAATLQLAPVKTILDLNFRIESIHASRACLQLTKMGFFIVAAPQRPVETFFTEEQLRVMVAFLKSEMDVVLVDTAVYWDHLTKVAMEESDVLLLMTTSDPASLSNVMRFAPLLNHLYPVPEVGIVWNRVLPGELLQDFSWPLQLQLPEETKVAAAVRKGKIHVHGPFAHAIQELVKKWLGNEPNIPTKEKPPWIRRLFRIP